MPGLYLTRREAVLALMARGVLSTRVYSAMTSECRRAVDELLFIGAARVEGDRYVLDMDVLHPYVARMAREEAESSSLEELLLRCIDPGRVGWEIVRVAAETGRLPGCLAEILGLSDEGARDGGEA